MFAEKLRLIEGTYDIKTCPWQFGVGCLNPKTGIVMSSVSQIHVVKATVTEKRMCCIGLNIIIAGMVMYFQR